MERFFSFHEVFADKQTLIATKYLYKWIKDWIQPLINKYFANKTNNENIFNKFKDLTKKIIIIFGFTNNKLLAKQHFLVLLQKKPTLNYTAIFQKYITKIKWNNKIKQFIFWNKFKKKIQNGFIWDEQTINLMDDFINVAIKINDIFHLLNQKENKNQFNQN